MRIRPVLTMIAAATLVSGWAAGRASAGPVRADGPLAAITGYRAVFRPYAGPDGRPRIAIREFDAAQERKLLSLDPGTFETEVVDAASVAGAGLPGRPWEDTPFYRALLRYTGAEARSGRGVENHGVTRGPAEGGGVYLTIDLCPTMKRLDRAVFEASRALMRGAAPAPIAVAVSGHWIRNHAEDLEWLRQEIKAGRFDVTWVNHSHSHPYRKGAPVERNHLLAPGVDFNNEVLDAEIEMLSSGITPPPFFRFPGLASDARLLSMLRGLTLIPIGADAWPAKGVSPEAGSIVLVHGNGNDPGGLAWLVSFYGEKRDDLGVGALKLLPLKDALKER